MQKANGGRIFGLQEKSLARCVTETNISFLVGSLWGRGGCIVLLRNRPRGPTRQIACSLAGAAGAAKSCEHFTSSRSLLTNSPLRFRPFERTINSERKARWTEGGREARDGEKRESGILICQKCDASEDNVGRRRERSTVTAREGRRPLSHLQSYFGAPWIRRIFALFCRPPPRQRRGAAHGRTGGRPHYLSIPRHSPSPCLNHFQSTDSVSFASLTRRCANKSGARPPPPPPPLPARFTGDGRTRSISFGNYVTFFKKRRRRRRRRGRRESFAERLLDSLLSWPPLFGPAPHTRAQRTSFPRSPALARWHQAPLTVVII